MGIIYLLCAVVWGILSIILFFKVWGMCNDVAKLTNYIMNKDKEMPNNDIYQEEPNEEGISELNGFKVGDLVVLKSTGKQMRVTSIQPNGTYECRTNGGANLEGFFTVDDIEKFKYKK